MSFVDFLNSDSLKNLNIKLIGNGYVTVGSVFFVDEDYVVLKSSNGELSGMRTSLIDYIKVADNTEDLQSGSTKSPSDRSAQSFHELPTASGPSEKAHTEASNGYSTGFREFKPGDRIPLDELAQRDPKLASGWKRREKKQYVTPDMSDRFSETMDEIRNSKRAEDDYSLVAFGRIIELQPGFLFGFIDDLKDGNRYYFNRSDIADPNLLDVSGKDIPVVYYRSRNQKGFAAKTIMLAGTVKDTLEIASSLLERGELFSARQVASIVLEIYPENTSALNVKESLNTRKEYEKGYNSSSYNGYSSYDNGENESLELFRFYKEGKRLLAQKDYRGAIQSYQTALDNGFRAPSCIKEIAQCYIGLYGRAETEEGRAKIAQEGIDFMDEYRDQLPDTLSTLFTLENFYFALGDYETHVDIIEDVIAECGKKNDVPQYTFYLNKAAQSYLRLGELDKAMDAVLDGLDADPEHPQLQKTQFLLMETMNKDTSRDEDK